jgi:hypothetical protein
MKSCCSNQRMCQRQLVRLSGIAFPFLHDRSPNDIDGSHGSHLRGMSRVSSHRQVLKREILPSRPAKTQI